MHLKGNICHQNQIGDIILQQIAIMSVYCRTSSIVRLFSF